MKLASMLNYQTGGEARRILRPAGLEELSQEVKALAEAREPYILIGEGTNSLAGDAAWDATVFSFDRLNLIQEIGPGRLVAGAGVRNSDLALYCLERGFGGAAWMFRLPGQLGATVRMNARCFGGEISQIVSEVVAVSPEGEVRKFAGPGVFRGYKDTIFMDNSYVVAFVQLSLKPAGAGEISAKMKECEEYRIRAGHFAYPSCGCVFKNDYNVGVSSGFLLDLAGMKNRVMGAAAVSDRHANFVYNTGGATSSDILRLSLMMREAVWQEFGAWLEYEMELLGTFPAAEMKAVWEQRPHQLKPARLGEAKALFKGKTGAS